MKRIIGWYKKYQEALDYLCSWTTATEARTATAGFLFVFGLGAWAAWRPFHSFMSGSALTDEIAVSTRRGSGSYVPIWQAGLWGVALIGLSLSIPLYYLVRRRGWLTRALDLIVRTRLWAILNRGFFRSHRIVVRIYRSHWLRSLVAFTRRTDCERLGISLPFAAVVGFPLWRVFESLCAGASWSESVNISPWNSAIPFPAWFVLVYAWAMAALLAYALRVDRHSRRRLH